MRSNLKSEDGAILVQVGLAMIVLIGFGMFAFDYGVMWSGRGLAQNAADSGALAGATSLAFDDFNDRTDTGPAKTAAHTFAVDNYIWGQAPANDVSTDVWFPTEPAALCADNSCIRVDVYRNSDHQNPLPTFFGNAVGLSSQGVQAMAIARAATGNATDCLKPWAVVDRWIEHYCWVPPGTNNAVGGECSPDPGTFNTSTSSFDKYYTSGSNQGQVDPAITPPDVYVPPSDGDFGSGYHPYNSDGSYSSDYGTELILKTGTPSQSNSGQGWGAGWFMALQLGDPGAKSYKENIKSCVGVTYAIGDSLELDNETGNMVGPTRQGVAQDVDSLCKQDPGAHWGTKPDGTEGVIGSAFAVSPRIVAVPLVNPDLLAQAVADKTANGKGTVPISNIMGFFVECPGDPGYPTGKMTGTNSSVIGRLMSMPGLISNGSGSTSNNSFLKVVQLVR